MKKIKKLMLVMIGIMIISNLKAQWAGHFELNKPIVNENSIMEVGIGLQNSRTLDYRDKFLIGLNSTVRYIAATKETRAFSIPLQLIGRYYFFGAHKCCGGAYLQTDAGLKYTNIQCNNDDNKTVTQIINPEVSAAIGYRFPLSYDISIRCNLYKPVVYASPSIGLRFGYTF